MLDELPEFPRQVLEHLRQPLEDGTVTVTRAAGALRFPARFMLVAAMNPCPCGYHGVPGRECTCSASQVVAYQRKVSGPLLDRIDLHLQVAPSGHDKLAAPPAGEASAAIRVRVEAARRIQAGRYAGSGLVCNSEMGLPEIRRHCRLSAEGADLLRRACIKLNLSARGYHRVLKLARTIADLAGSADIRPPHLAEAVQYRSRPAWP